MRYFCIFLFYAYSSLFASHHQCLELIEEHNNELAACECLIPLAKDGNLHARGYLLRLKDVEGCYWQTTQEEIDLYELTQWPESHLTLEASFLISQLQQRENTEQPLSRLRALSQKNVAHALYLLAKYAALLDSLSDHMNEEPLARAKKARRGRVKKVSSNRQKKISFSEQAVDNFMRAAGLGHLRAIEVLMEKDQWQPQKNITMFISLPQIMISMHANWHSPFKEEWEVSKKKSISYHSLANLLTIMRFIRGDKEASPFLFKLPLDKASILLAEYLKNAQNGDEVNGLVDYLGDYRNKQNINSYAAAYLQSQALRYAVERFFGHEVCFIGLLRINIFNFENRWPSMIEPQSEEELLRAKDWVLNQLLIMEYAPLIQDFDQIAAKLVKDKSSEVFLLESSLYDFVDEFSSLLHKESSNKYIRELFDWLFEQAWQNKYIAQGLYGAFQRGIPGLKNGYSIFLPVLESMLRNDPGNQELLMSLGTHLERMNDFKGALEVFRYSWSLGNARGATGMANILLKLGGQCLQENEKKALELCFLAHNLFEAAINEGDHEAEPFLRQMLNPDDFARELLTTKVEDVCTDYNSAANYGLNFIQASAEVIDIEEQDNLLRKAVHSLQFALIHAESAYNKGHSHTFLSMCFMFLGDFATAKEHLLSARDYWESWQINEIFDLIWHSFMAEADKKSSSDNAEKKDTHLQDIESNKQTEPTQSLLVENILPIELLINQEEIPLEPAVEDPLSVIKKMFPDLKITKRVIKNIQLLFDEKKMKNHKRSKLLQNVWEALGAKINNQGSGSRRKFTPVDGGRPYQDHNKSKKGKISDYYLRTQLCQLLMEQGVVIELINHGLVTLPDEFKYLLPEEEQVNDANI